MKEMKIVGRKGRKPPMANVAARDWLRLINQLRKGKGICPKGVYRFTTHQEADEWMNKMTLKTFLESPKLKIS